MAISKNNSIFRKLLDQNAFTVEKAVDLGCGKGGDAKLFAKAGFEVTAVDKSKENISTLEKSIEEEPQNIKPVEADILNFQIEKDTYNLASSQYTLQFLKKDDAKMIIGNMIEGCKSKGIIIFTLIGNNDEWKDKWSTWDKAEAVDFIKAFPVTIRNTIEEEGVDATQAGPLKWWHVITFVLSKN